MSVPSEAILFAQTNFVEEIELKFKITPDASENDKVHVGKDQEKAQSEKDSYSKNRGGKKPN